MGLGSATGLTATFLALLLLSPVEATLTRFSLLVEDSTEFGCLTQAYTEQRPASLSEPLGIQLVGSSNECTTSTVSTLNQGDVDKVSGKVAVFRMCSGATSFNEYYADYYHKTFELEQSGAVVVIPVEAWIAKLPQHMDSGPVTKLLNIPICIMELRVFDGLKLLIDEPGVQGNFSSLIFYSADDEPDFDTPITSVTVELNKNDHSFSFPATTSTFNNDTTPAITGTLLPLQLRPECYHSPSSSWDKCVECWSLDRIGNAPGPVLNHNQIMTASTSAGQYVLFVGLEAQGALKGHRSTCFEFYYHWAVFGARLLTDAVLIGGLSNTNLAIPGPNLVGTRTVPTFSIINMHSNAFSDLLSERMEFGNVTVVLPALEKQQGPPFYAPVEQELGITKIGLFDDSPADSGEEDRHFECLAAQATFNPEQYNGSPAPMISRDGEIQADSTYRVVYVKPSADCGDEATCGRCLSKPTGKLDLDPDVDYGSLVILLHEDDFPCFLSHSEFSQAAVEAGPNALIVAQLGSFSHTVSDSEMARLAFPTFAVDKGCGTRAIDNCDPEASLCPDALYVQLPKLENGVAVGETTTSYTEEGMEPGYIQFASPEALESLGVIPVGTANFNPKDHLSVTAPIALAQTVEICNAQATCVECDRLEWRWKQPPSEFKDRVALFSRAAFDGDHIEISEDGGYVFTNLPTVAAQGKCLLPRGNIVEELQEAGAKGVIFVEWSNETLTYVQEGVPPDTITIPSFNIPLYAGVMMIEHADEGIVVELPQLKGGIFSIKPPQVADSPDPDGPGKPNASDLTGSDVLLPGWAIALVVVGGCLFLCGCGCTVYFVRRRRRMFAYNQMDSAVQADVMADIMTLPGNGGFDDGGFHNEPLDSGSNDSDDESGHYGFAHTGNGAGGMQMVELGNTKQDAATGATDYSGVFP